MTLRSLIACMLLSLLPALAAAQGCVYTCGNGALNAGEECDDVNLDDGDGCSSTCQLELDVWTCPASWYGDAICDCGCGLPDELDCLGSGPDYCEACFGCNSFEGCPGTLDPNDVAICSDGRWLCSEQHYGTDDGCDCGCGMPDPDCSSAAASACEYFEGCGGPSSIEPLANHLCVCAP